MNPLEGSETGTLGTQPHHANAAPPPLRTPQKEEDIWRTILELQKQSDERAGRMQTLYRQLEETHKKHREEANCSHMQAVDTLCRYEHRIQELMEDVQRSRQNALMCEELLKVQGDRLGKLVKDNDSLRAQSARIAQSSRTAEDRAEVAELAKRMAEMRQGDVEAALGFAVQRVALLEQQVAASDTEKQVALRQQQENFTKQWQECARQQYSREVERANHMQSSMNAFMQHVLNLIRDREQELSRYWYGVLGDLRSEFISIQQTMLTEKVKMERHFASKATHMEDEKKMWYEQHQREMVQVQEQCNKREQSLLYEIARRDREAEEQEQRNRIRRAEEEQKRMEEWATKENELREHYDKRLESAAVSFGKECEALSEQYRSQLEQLSSMYLRQQQELERSHRAREREITQRYRAAALEDGSYRRTDELRDTVMQSQEALLSRLDDVQLRQWERAERTRAAMQDQLPDTPS